MSFMTGLLADRIGKYCLGGLLLFSWNCAALGPVFSQSTLPPAERKRQVISEKQLDSDLKSLLNEYYSGKPVRAKIVIPANERGIEVVDGQLKVYPLPELTVAVQPGEMVLIKELRFKSKEIEVRFNGEHLSETANADPAPLALAPVGPHGSDATVPKAAFVEKTVKPTKPAKALPDPRVILRFTRDIETRDLNLQSINRLLSSAIDTTSLSAAAAVSPRTESAPRPTVSERAQQTANEQGIPIAPITGDLVGGAANIGEVIIECPVVGARLYIDGTYSGTAPRTVQLLMGIHTILITTATQGQFEQRFFLPAGKIATIKAEFRSK